MIDVLEERAPDGFARIEDVAAPGELESIAARYKVLTGLRPQAPEPSP